MASLPFYRVRFDQFFMRHVVDSVDNIIFNLLICFQDGSLPFARSIKDTHSEFRLLSKLTDLLMNQGEQEEALQYATLAVQIASKTGTQWEGLM